MTAICFLLIFAAITSLGDEQAPPVDLVLSTPQTEYVIGDPVPVTLLIRARDSSQVLEYRDDAFRNFLSNLSVVDPHGRRLSKFGIRDGHRFGEGWTAVATNGSMAKSIDLTEVYSEPFNIRQPHSLTEIGEYSVSVFSEKMAIRSVGASNNLWGGAVTSTPLTVKIIGVDSGSLQVARQMLTENGTDRSMRLRALTKMQYSDDKLTPDDYDLLRSLLRNDDVTFKNAVIRVLGAKTSEESFKIISGILATETNSSMRAEAVSVLERNPTAEARQLVLKACETRKGGYRAAIVVLGNVGDESCIEALREIAETDETEWVRKRALESIKKIEERSTKK